MKIYKSSLALALFVFAISSSYGIDRLENNLGAESSPSNLESEKIEVDSINSNQSSTMRTERSLKRSCLNRNGFRYYEHNKGYQECVNSSNSTLEDEKW